MLARSFTTAASSLVSRFPRSAVLAGVALTLLTASRAQTLTFPVFAQTVELTALTPAISESAYGNQLAVPDLPSPKWQEQWGVPVARLRFRTADAAGWRLDFRSFGLPAGAQMFLYGVDASGVIRAAHGPYEENGPLAVQGFATKIIEGADFYIEVRGKLETEGWPFEIERIESLSASQLESAKQAGVQLEASYHPPKAEYPKGELRSAWLDDQLVQYRVVDGWAIMEGDIVLGRADDVASGMSAKSNGRRESHEDANAARRWPGGVIPYTVNHTPTWTASGIVRDSELDIAIEQAIEMWNEVFPGILVPRTNQADYVQFVRDGGLCRSELGRRSGKQLIWVNDSCSAGMIAHEIGHSLGLFHEHQRPDRDQHITIKWENVKPELMDQFTIPSAGTTRMLGAYDYGSIMHYGMTQGGIAGKITIQPPPDTGIGQRREISAGDQNGIKSRYCNPKNWSMPNTIYAGPLASSGTFQVMAPPYCGWIISNIPSWVTLPGTYWGTYARTGPATVPYNVPTTIQPRIGDMTVISTGTDKIRIEQEGENLRF